MIQVYAPHNEMDDEEEERDKATYVSANGRVRNQKPRPYEWTVEIFSLRHQL